MKKVFPIIFLSILFSACSGFSSSSRPDFGKDANYYLALQSLQKGEEEESIRLFKIARNKGTNLIARRSAEALVKLGDLSQRMEAANFLIQNYQDEESLLTACRQFYDYEEYAKVISLTEKCDLSKDKNEIIALRLKSLAKKNDSRFNSEFFQWFMERAISPQHIELIPLYQEHELDINIKIQEASEKFQKDLNKKSLLESQLAPVNPIPWENSLNSENSQAKIKNSTPQTEADQEKIPEESNIENIKIQPEEGFESLIEELQEAENPQKFLIDFRVSVYRRSYFHAFSLVNKVLQIYRDCGDEIHAQILSDIGKATLYGTSDYLASARTFDSYAKKLPPEKAYFAYFYAARLYDKAGRYQNQVVSRFRSALKSTSDEMRFDNCLWYLLNFQLRTSTDDIISTLTEFGSRIHDPIYFDDFFESLSILLLSSHRWQDFYKVWKKTDSRLSDYTDGKYAYISGRLIEEGLAKGDEGLKTRQAVDAFTRVLNGGASLYYKVCALERLNVRDQDLIWAYLQRKNGGEEIPDMGAKRLLDGYAAFGFPQKIYPEWLANRKNLRAEESLEVSKSLNRFAESDPKGEYMVQALRIAARTYSNPLGNEEKIPRELLEATFPRYYKEIVENACQENSLDQALMYALIRSESFFDKDISSKAGAQGLTQLMEATASDEAKKLGLGENYDIFDPETNIRMGSHYLSSLIGRVDKNNELLALYAYNAGLTNVRQWVRRFRNDWSTTGRKMYEPAGISLDLFLESLPFAETREYGRKVVSAAVIYGFLYEKRLPGDIVREIMY